MKKHVPAMNTQYWKSLWRFVYIACVVLAAFFLILGSNIVTAQSSDPTQSGSVGLTGTVSSPPPTQAATITVPANGQTFSSVPITVGGLCESGLLVKLFKNNVFAGSAQCENGSYSIEIDLFSGTNELVARVFDDLDQPGPDSNVVTVQFVDDNPTAGPRVTVTSNFAKRGANPNDTLTWPIIISGGSGPYAISIDWGDGSPQDLLSQPFAGSVDLAHVYESSGVYTIIIKVSDANGGTAFLQVVGVANGPLSQTSADGELSETGQVVQTRILWWPIVVTIPLIIVTFWLGRRYTLKNLRRRILRGEHPFTDL